MRGLLLTICLLASVSVSAQDYSGVWAVPSDVNTEFYSFHQNGDQIMIAVLDTISGSWVAYQGGLNENSVEFEPVFTPNGIEIFTVNFLSETTGYVEIRSKPCDAVPGQACAAIYSRTYLLEKIF